MDEVARKRMRGQREQARAFLVQGVGDAAAGGIAGHGALMRGVGDPLGELGVEVVDGGEAARGEERVAEVLDHPLDAAFLIAAGDGARLRGEVVVAGELEQARVEADVLAEALEDDTFQVVVEQDARECRRGRRRPRRGRGESSRASGRGQSGRRRRGTTRAPARNRTGRAGRRRSGSRRSGPSPPGLARRPACRAGRTPRRAPRGGRSGRSGGPGRPSPGSRARGAWRARAWRASAGTARGSWR